MTVELTTSLCLEGHSPSEVTLCFTLFHSHSQCFQVTSRRLCVDVVLLDWRDSSVGRDLVIRNQNPHKSWTESHWKPQCWDQDGAEEQRHEDVWNSLASQDSQLVPPSMRGLILKLKMERDQNRHLISFSGQHMCICTNHEQPHRKMPIILYFLLIYFNHSNYRNPLLFLKAVCFMRILKQYLSSENSLFI